MSRWYIHLLKGDIIMFQVFFRKGDDHENNQHPSDMIKQLTIVAGAICLIIASGYYFVLMSSSQVWRSDWFGGMSQYTAAGSLGVIIGIWILVRAVKNVIWV